LKEFFEKHVTKKDLIYVMLLIITLLIISLLRGQLNSSEVVNVISIGAGLTSIFLAMAAIVYSFIQSSEASRQNHSVQETLNKITDKVEEAVLIKQEILSFKEDSQQNSNNLGKQIEELARQFEIIFTLSKSKEVSPAEIVKNINEHEETVKDKLKELQDKVYKLEDSFEVDLVNYINFYVEDQEIFNSTDFIEYHKNKNGMGFHYTKLKKVIKKLISMGMLEECRDGEGKFGYRKIGRFEVLERI